GDRERLGLPAGEQRAAVRARQQAGLDRDRADLVLAAPVGALLVDGDALADDLLLEPVERELGLLAELRILGRVDRAGVLLDDLLLDGLGGRLAVELVVDLRRGVQRGAVRLADL